MQSLEVKPAPIAVQANSLRSKPVLSTCLALLAILLLGDALERFVQPLQYVSDPRLRPIQYDPWVAKFPRFFESNANPDLVIIGSSLPMAAFGRYDAIFDRNESLKNAANLRTYLDSKYFLHLLNSLGKNNSTAFGNVGSIGNLTCAGCMVSDAFAISDGVLTKKQTPKLVIFGIAPRDFQDNCMPKMGDSPILQVVPSFETWADVRHAHNPTEFLSRLTACLSDFYRSRRKYRDFLVCSFSEWSKHPQTLYAGRSQPTATQAPLVNGAPSFTACAISAAAKPPTLEEDLATYKSRYNPFNQERFAQEREYFKKLIGRLSAKGVEILLVRMPLTEKNKQLIPTPLAQGFEQALDEAKKNSKVRYIEFAPDEFSQADFVDSVHLNAAGSKKFEDKLAAILGHS